MPYDDPDPTDPMTLTGVALEAPAGAAEEAAYAFAEELSRSGLSRASVMLTFRTPEYRGPYGAYLALGDQRISEIVNECCAVFDACRGACAGSDHHA